MSDVTADASDNASNNASASAPASTRGEASATAAGRRCRFCATALEHEMVDLGMSPLCQTQIREAALDAMERFYPLQVLVCPDCRLAQVGDYVAPDEIFAADYPYFSSFSTSWLAHAAGYATRMIDELGLGADSLVMEAASNDGYLLRNFVAAGVPVVGIEPTAGTAAAAREAGVRTEERFLGAHSARELVDRYGRADLVLGNNVLAHVPDLNDFVAGLKILMAPGGRLTMEFPHLQRLMEGNQFDTIYHEHFSYFSWFTVKRVFVAHDIELFDVDELPTHGGSLRIHGRHAGETGVGGDAVPVGELSARARAVEAAEAEWGVEELATYSDFGERVRGIKQDLLGFLIEQKRAGRSVVGYGAPGKGNTLLNYCGIRTDFLDYTVDRNPHKRGTWTPGTRIPILDPARIAETRPDFVLILPWNLRDELVAQLAYVREWGGKLVFPIPALEIV